MDANNIEESIRSGEDIRLSLKPIVTNPARLNRHQRRHEDLRFRASAEAYIRAGYKREFTAANGKTFTGLEIESNPELVNESLLIWRSLDARLILGGFALYCCWLRVFFCFSYGVGLILA